jgi:hypothetical protein
LFTLNCPQFCRETREKRILSAELASRWTSTEAQNPGITRLFLMWAVLGSNQ